MAKTPKQLDEFLNPMRHQDLSTLRALDQKLRLLLQQKLKDERPANGDIAVREEISAQCPGVRIDPDLIALVGIHPENLVAEDKTPIYDIVSERFSW